MKWFEGNISDAVASSKARNAVFVVFVEGPDAVSQSVATAINNTEVSSKLESSDFVAIKLDSGTEPYRQFAQIYQVVPVPSLFFIGRDGRPLEIVAGSSTSSEIVQRIEKVLSKTAGTSRSDAGPAGTASSVGGITEAARRSPSREDVAEPPSTSVAAERSLTEAEAKSKVDAAKAAVEKIRLKKEAEEKAAEREREVERRKVGQEVQRLRQWQQDQEYKQLKEDREKEKREEAAARERVRNMIAQDKAERAKRNNQAQETKEAVQDVPRYVSNSETARLQLRLPDGSAITHQLASSAPLGELRAFVSERLNQTPSNFSMSTTFPRRVLAPAEDSQTMTQLELVPTAVILILPVSGRDKASAGGIVRSAPSAITPVTRVFWALLTPILSIFSYVRNLVFGRGGANQTSGVSSDASSRRRFSPEASAQGGPTRRMPATSEVRRQGNSNIHRLAQPRDSSDEDNNTWNGNSTQQM